jgi:putative membrane protein
LNRWKLGGAVAMLIGIALTVGVVLYVGAGGLLNAVTAVGWGGFGVYVLYNLAVFLPLGLAWWSVAPGAGWGRWLLFPWGRLLREAAADVLPFSQVGGFLVGVRAVQQRGVSEALVVGSLIVDLTTEMASQLVYTVFGAAMLAAMLSHATGARSLLWIALGALGLGAVLLGAFVALQGRGVNLVGSLAARWLKDTRSRADAVQAVLKTIYAAPTRLGAGVFLHGAAWVASGIGSWLALWLMGAHRPLWQVLTLESLIAAVKSIAFMTPGALGFQEGAYVLVGPLFGLGPESALALSLIKRAKDLAIGAPALLIWQAGEGRRLLLKN